MPTTPLTTECRAIAERMRAFPSLEGNAQYLRKLIYEDSAKVVELIPLVETATQDQDIVRGVYNAAAVCGSSGECSGNIGMWALVPAAAGQLDAALDVVEGAAVGGGGDVINPQLRHG